ncbi:hypothetical protein DVH24_020846 [Malus domestica]|uniref:Uncharacterized protein n=1 Tax=Malus domestica TaxID=3750 RepID=A0A498JDC0_MALDO|nr:hypothetical protein DVH24_020846 [Malus domestica]
MESAIWMGFVSLLRVTYPSSFYSYSYLSSQTTADSLPSSPITAVATITIPSPSHMLLIFSFTFGLLSVCHSSPRLILSRVRYPLHSSFTNTLPLSISHLLHHPDITAVASIGLGDHHDSPAISIVLLESLTASQMIEIPNVLQEIKTEKLRDFTLQNGAVCFNGIGVRVSTSKGKKKFMEDTHKIAFFGVWTWWEEGCTSNCNLPGSVMDNVSDESRRWQRGEDEQMRGCWGGSLDGLQDEGFAQGISEYAGEGNEGDDEDHIAVNEDLDLCGLVGTSPFQQSGLGLDPILKNPKPTPPHLVLCINGPSSVRSILDSARSVPTPIPHR